MIRDILVHIPTERQVRPVVDGAVSLAAAHQAHLDAVAMGYVSDSTASMTSAGMALTGVFEQESERAMARAKAALGVFDVEARNAGISFASRALSGFPADASEAVGAMARLYDLTVVLQPDMSEETFDNTLPQEILFRCGGPVLFIPYIFRGEFRAKRIGICWDGSRLAARALRDAAPFLARADALLIASVGEANRSAATPSADDLAKHQARKGLPAKIETLTASHADIQPTILSWAADESIDMLVMGAYGHSRMQEMLLGGVTRNMLRSMTVPTLMSH